MHREQMIQQVKFRLGVPRWVLTLPTVVTLMGAAVDGRAQTEDVVECSSECRNECIEFSLPVAREHLRCINDLSSRESTVEQCRNARAQLVREVEGLTGEVQDLSEQVLNLTEELQRLREEEPPRDSGRGGAEAFSGLCEVRLAECGCSLLPQFRYVGGVWNISWGTLNSLERDLGILPRLASEHCAEALAWLEARDDEMRAMIWVWLEDIPRLCMRAADGSSALVIPRTSDAAHAIERR